jgi:hypothetical protein
VNFKKKLSFFPPQYVKHLACGGEIMMMITIITSYFDAL